MRRLGGVLLLLTAMAMATPAHAQTPNKQHRVAVLSQARAELNARLALPEIARHGFVEGRNLAVDIRTGGADELPGLARELVAAKPDVILAVSPPAVRAAAAATSTIPIVVVASADPVEAGWVDSLARPGRNITGVLIFGFGNLADRLAVAGQLLDLIEHTVAQHLDGPHGGAVLDHEPRLERQRILAVHAARLGSVLPRAAREAPGKHRAGNVGNLREAP